MPDATPIKRQWTLLRSLSSRQYGLTVREMAAEAGVNAKTIRRDLDLFREIGVVLEETTGDFALKRWKIRSWTQPPLCFPLDEALASTSAASSSSRWPAPCSGTPPRV